MTVKDMLGKRFDHLVVVERFDNAKDGTARWRCVCSCGSERIICGTALRSGRNKSCGCMSPRFTSQVVMQHGMSRSRVYKIWQGMIQRCSEKSKGKTRALYFSKGIKVCDRWKNFEHFLLDMGMPPDGSSIDRIDGSKGYQPDNCRWASSKVQANNASSNLIISANGKTMTAAQWSDETGIKANTIVYRIRRGWEPERAISSNPGNLNSIRKMKREAECKTCGAIFVPRIQQVKNGGGKFCSQKCNGEFQKSQNFTARSACGQS